MYQTGEKIKVTVFGQSHSEAIGAVIEGLPAGIKLDMERIYAFMRRRAPGRDKFSTPRKEADLPEIISGLADGKTCGAPITAVIKNGDTKSKDYENLRLVPRPGHSDFTAFVKYGGCNDIRGGGQFSGRMTAPLCFAGAICMQLLEEKGIYIGAHIESVHGIHDERFNPINVTKDELDAIKAKDFCVISDKQGEAMKAEIDRVRGNLDSVGGTIECAVIGMPTGVGGPLFGGIEGRISSAIFAIPAVKGIEFGSGFSASEMYGSENNDSFYFDEDCVKTKTNNHGGILGGISSGMPILFRTAIKPTPSIAREQDSVNLKTKTSEKLVISGRHDPCIVQRAVPVIEAAAAITILDMLGE
ncbi:MAG: chorismate synthase [Clostridia bacterium]|nr:chorismate synthase [Clostridia bacterium]